MKVKHLMLPLALGAVFVSSQARAEEGGADPPAVSTVTPTEDTVEADTAAAVDENAKAVNTVALTDEAMEAGKALFAEKGCSACHATDTKTRKVGPPLGGSAKNRTEKWLREMITDPAGLIKRDEAAKALFKEYKLKMPAPKLTEDEVDTLLVYLVSLCKE